MTPTTEDIRLLEIYAVEKARQEAERKHAQRYSEARNPDSLLSASIFEIIASSASATLDRELSDPAVKLNVSNYPEWNTDMRARLVQRLENDFVFGQLVRSQVAMVIQEVDAYKTGTRVVRTTQAHPWLELHAAIAKEREECAKVAEGEIFGHVGTQDGFEVARLIRERK